MRTPVLIISTLQLGDDSHEPADIGSGASAPRKEVIWAALSSSASLFAGQAQLALAGSAGGDVGGGCVGGDGGGREGGEEYSPISKDGSHPQLEAVPMSEVKVVARMSSDVGAGSVYVEPKNSANSV